jgi:hypothetical protein
MVEGGVNALLVIIAWLQLLTHIHVPLELFLTLKDLLMLHIAHSALQVLIVKVSA